MKEKSWATAAGAEVGSMAGSSGFVGWWRSPRGDRIGNQKVGVSARGISAWKLALVLLSVSIRSRHVSRLASPPSQASTSFRRTRPIFGQERAGKSNSRTMVFRSWMGPSSTARRFLRDAFRIEREEVELEGFQRGAAAVVHEEIGAARLARRLETVELELQRAGFRILGDGGRAPSHRKGSGDQRGANGTAGREGWEFGHAVRLVHNGPILLGYGSPKSHAQVACPGRLRRCAFANGNRRDPQGDRLRRFLWH